MTSRDPSIPTGALVRRGTDSLPSIPNPTATRRIVATSLVLCCALLGPPAWAQEHGAGDDGAPDSIDRAAAHAEFVDVFDGDALDGDALEWTGRGPVVPLVIPQPAPTRSARHEAGGPSASQAALAPVDVPLLVHQALPKDAAATAHPDAIVTFGLPFPEGQVPEIAGRPALRVKGGGVWQASTLDRWDDGSVRWALIDTRASVGAGQTVGGLSVVAGVGKSAGSNLAWETIHAIRVKTGALELWIPRTTDEQGWPLLWAKRSATSSAVPAAPLWVVGQDLGLAQLSAGPGTHAEIIYNGPAKTLIRIDGPVVDPSGQAVLDFSAYVTARHGRSDLEVAFTVRNASITRQMHVQVESLGLALDLSVGVGATGSVAGPDGPLQMPLAPSGHLFAYQAYSSAPTIHTDVKEYLPHLPKLAGSQTEYVHEGYQVNVNGFDLQPLGDKDAWPEHAWIDVSGPTGGVTASIQRGPYWWPGALEVLGKGLVVAGLFTARNPAPYTFVWRQHESRTVVFSLHAPTVPVEEMEAVAQRLDHPLAARAKDYGHYDDARVFPYRLVTIAEQQQAYAWMGLQHKPIAQNDSMTVMRYIGKSFTGGHNNYALIEDRLGARWLRHGLGGHYLKGLDFALWKSEWQIKRSDDFVYQPDMEPLNDDLPVTTRAFGDEEHRYREGIILAYWLTGDPRYRDAIFDEAELLSTITFYQQERSMYQTLRASALVAEFTGNAALLADLEERTDWFCSKTLDIYTEASGWGWETAPDVGVRRYFANSAENKAEKPPGENYQMRGWVTAALGPVGLYHAGRVLDASLPESALARGRMRDLSFWTRQELFPFVPDPFHRHLPYSYAVTLQEFTITEIYDFHPILFGMAESFVDTGDVTYLKRGVHQVEAFATHDAGPYDDNLYLLDTRFDSQHFFAIYRDWYIATHTN